ncbi:hypothetical protein EYF80_045270 [Liparis tanakae]|uniref:Uncharacterized protein n=1 Tax=Liparis tanakae TaxID=230148 RepID=A0A4Z2FTF0_9TELE|nr:hypothetical protein EYF80_045270 [Liparis tanakae]
MAANRRDPAQSLPEGGDLLRLAAQQPGGHLVGHQHGNAVTGCHGNELLRQAVEEARPARQLVKVQPERERHAVDRQEADLRVFGQEVGQQVDLCEQLHVVMTTHLRDQTAHQNHYVNNNNAVNKGLPPIGAVPDGGRSDVDDPLKQEAALGIDVDRLTADAPKTRRHLNVHRQLQAERMSGLSGSRSQVNWNPAERSLVLTAGLRDAPLSGRCILRLGLRGNRPPGQACSAAHAQFIFNEPATTLRFVIRPRQRFPTRGERRLFKKIYS